MTWDNNWLALNDNIATGSLESGGVNYFRRVRFCTECRMQLETVELDEARLWELLRLRDEVARLREQHEAAAAHAGALAAILVGVSQEPHGSMGQLGGRAATE